MSCTHFYFVRFSTNFQGHKGEHRWDIIIVPKNIGGLGIDKIKTTNLALLSKWLWRYQSEVESLWRSLIEAKYKAASPNQFPCVSRHHSSKSPWHNIIKLQRYITGNTEWQIADGRSTLFWFSNWNNKGCLNISIPRFFALSSNPNLFVFEAWDPKNQCWNLHPRRPLIQREKDLWNATTAGWPQPTREPRDDKIKW